RPIRIRKYDITRRPRRRVLCFGAPGERLQWNFAGSRRLNMCRRTAMRAWMIPIVGVAALSLAIPAPADARPRFGPAAVLGAVFGGLLFGHHRGHARSAPDRRHARSAPVERPHKNDARIERQPVAGAEPQRASSVFWPSASTDLVEYILFPQGQDDRFWAYGFGSILEGVFAGAGADARSPGGRPAAGEGGGAASRARKESPAATDSCGSGQVSADDVIARIEQDIAPQATQREVLDELRTSLKQVIERVQAVCPATTAATPMDRLQTILDRIWAMHDALLTIRLPLEKFYGSLTDEQRGRLRRDDGEGTVGVSEGRDQTCGEQTAAIADPAMRAIERALRPTEHQLATLHALQMRSAGMAQLIASTCPIDSPLG